MTFELAWKVIKDYLEEQGFNNIKSPRSTLKKAFEIELISDRQNGLELSRDRNLTTPTYDEEKATGWVFLFTVR